MTKWEVWGGGCELGVEGEKERKSDTFGLLFVHFFSTGMATLIFFSQKRFFKNEYISASDIFLQLYVTLQRT